MAAWVGAMRSSDGRWMVRVGGVGATEWYRLEGPGVARNLPSRTALLKAVADHGVDLADLREVKSAA